MFNREPILWLAVVQALIALVTSFGLDMSGEQTGAIMAVSAALLGLIARQRVSPVVPAHVGDDRGRIDLFDLLIVVAVVIVALFIWSRL